MIVRAVHLALVAVVLAACTATPPAGSISSPTASAVALPTRTASPAASVTPASVTPSRPDPYRQVTTAGDLPLLSPDGTTLVSVDQGAKGAGRAFVFQSLDGAVLRRIPDDRAAGRMTWLPDSSGVFVELAAGQRAGPLGVLTPQGSVLETGLDYADPALSPDGKWIAAEHQEGCCASIRTREIRLVPRSGGVPRTIASSAAPENVPQPIALLGWDARGGLVYRDADSILRVTVDGARAEIPAPASMKGRMPVAAAVSPDRAVILVCAADPLAFWTIANGQVAELPRALRPAWRLREPWCSDATEVPWYGPHGLLLRDVANTLQQLDATSGGVSPQAFIRSDVLLAASGYIVLASIGDDVWIMSGAGGRATGLRARPSDLVVWPIANSSFFLRSGTNAYVVALSANASADPSWKQGPELRFPSPSTADNNVRCGILAEKLTRPGEGSGASVISPTLSAALGVGHGVLVGLPDQNVPPFGSYICVRIRPGAPMAGFGGWVQPGDTDYVPASALVPTGFALPSTCSYLGTPTADPNTGQVVWKVSCGATADRDARGTLAPALTQQGWTSCGSGLGVAIWTKDARTLTIVEGAGGGDPPAIDLRNNSSCP